MKITLILYVGRLALIAKVCIATYTRDIARRRDTGFWMGYVLPNWMLCACLYLANVRGCMGL